MTGYDPIFSFAALSLYKALTADSKNMQRLIRCQNCGKFDLKKRVPRNGRNTFCNRCSLKSKMTKEERRKYQKHYRQKKQYFEMLDQYEAQIKRMIDAGFTREEAAEMIKDDLEM